MTKIGKLFRETVDKRLQKEIKNSDTLLMLQYSGLSSVQMTLLRTVLKEAQSRLFVTKISLIRKALKDAKIEGLDSFLEGPTAIVFAPKDISNISKVLAKFAKENTQVNLRGAYFEKRILNKKDLQAISELPSKDILIATVVFSIKAPLSNLVYTLQGNLNKLVTILNQIKDKKK